MPQGNPAAYRRPYSKRAYRKAMRRFPGPGGIGRPKFDPRERRPILFPPGGGQGGYGGLDDIIARLSQGDITQQQMDRMAEGRTGGRGWGVIGGMGGLMSGLSPYATNWLATSGILKRNEYEGTDIEGLEGADLFRAQLMNSLGEQNYAANPTYDLAEGIDEDFLSQIFSMGFGGKGAYERGFGAEGALPGRPRRPFRPPIRRNRPGRSGGRLVRGGQGGRGGGMTIGRPGKWW